MKELILYGLKGYTEVISRIIKELDLWKEEFDIKLMLTEALTNAFKHGNGEDSSKPIYLKYSCINGCFKVQVHDSGEKENFVVIPEDISEGNIMELSGRGLFIIKSLADKVEFKNNTLILCKRLRNV